MKIFILSFLNWFIFALYCYFVGYVILQKKPNNIKKIFIAIIPFIIMYYCIFCLLDSIYAIFFSGFCACLFIKITFNENNFMSLFMSIILHFIKFFFKMIILCIMNNDSLLFINTYKSLDWNAFYINLLSLVVSTVFIFLLRNILRKLVKYISHLKNRQLILLITIYLNFIIILLIQPPFGLSTVQTVTDFLIIFTVTGIGIFSISSEMKMESLMYHYEEIFEYSKASAQLLNNYKMQVHENKNRLLMIREMIDGPKSKTKQYIDDILEEIKEDKDNTNYWLTELKYIPLPGVRNFINCKLIQLKKLGAEIEVFVSSELESIDTSSLNDREYNQMTTILGVILDNMIESISKTEEKLISINIYMEDNKIKGDFVNNFTGSIDLSRLNELGYTTKGDQHGVGLPLVAKIVKMNDRFDCNPEIMDNFFIQHLSIKICNKNNLQKMSKN